MCKWHNSKRAFLRRLRSNPQSLADPESSQSAPTVLSRRRRSPLSLAQPKSSQPASALGLCCRRVADFDAFAVALICYATWGYILQNLIYVYTAKTVDHRATQARGMNMIMLVSNPQLPGGM